MTGRPGFADRAQLRQAGRDAWAAGLPRVPGASPLVAAWAAGPPGSGYAQAARAWLAGWDAANLAAAVPDQEA